MLQRKVILYALIPVMWISCRHENQQPQSVEPVAENMIIANKRMIQAESKKIEDFIAEHQWKTVSTGTGLRYEIYHQGKGKQAANGKPLDVSYSAYLLDGTLCYSYDTKHPLRTIPGRGELTRGLEEGILLMKEGDQARMVVPPHLAYGNSGDGDKIPGSSSVYYDVTLLKVYDTE